MNIMLYFVLIIVTVTFSKFALVETITSEREVTSVCFSKKNNTNLLAFGDGDGIIHVGSIDKWKEIRSFNASYWIEGIDMHNNVLASANYPNMLRVWDIEKGKEVWNKDFSYYDIKAVSLNPINSIVAVGLDKNIEIVNIVTHQKIKTLKYKAETSSLDISPDGKLLASASNKHLKLWNMDNFKAKTLEKSGDLTVATFNPSGTVLAAVYGKNIKLYDVGTGVCIKILTGHDYIIYSIAFSPDGKLLASGSLDMTAKVWDVSTGECIQTMTGFGFSCNSVSFSDDGMYLATGSPDSTVRIWKK